MMRNPWCLRYFWPQMDFQYVQVASNHMTRHTQLSPREAWCWHKGNLRACSPTTFCTSLQRNMILAAIFLRLLQFIRNKSRNDKLLLCSRVLLSDPYFHYTSVMMSHCPYFPCDSVLVSEQYCLYAHPRSLRTSARWHVKYKTSCVSSLNFNHYAV